MSNDYLATWAARAEATRTKFGIELPVVDWIAPQARASLGTDEDLLAKWIVEQLPELAPFELIVEDVGPGAVTVVFAGMTRDLKRRFIERRLVIELQDDLTYYSERVEFAIVRSETLRDESDLVLIRTPRWAVR